MDVRHLTVPEYVALCKIQAIAFVYPIDVAADEKQAAEKPDELNWRNAWGCFDDGGRLTCGVEDKQYRIRYDGHVVGMGGIGGVASLPEGRMRGGIRAIFERVFEENRAQGVLFSLLYPFSHPYYRQFGYEICYEGRQVRFPIGALKPYKPYAGEVRMPDAAEGAAPFAPVYAAFADRYNQAAARGDAEWKRMLRGDPYKAEAYRYVLSREGASVAYCMFRLDKDSKPGARVLNVYDWAYVDREALWALLGFLYRLSAQYTHVQLELPSDFDMTALLEEPYDLEPGRVTRVMARIVDVERALSLMCHPEGSGAYTLRVQDDFLPVNSGTYAVSYDDGGVRVSRGEDGAACDMELSVQALAQLCLGYLPLASALLRRDVTLYGNEALLSRVFVRKASYLSDRF